MKNILAKMVYFYLNPTPILDRFITNQRSRVSDSSMRHRCSNFGVTSRWFISFTCFASLLFFVTWSFGNPAFATSTVYTGHSNDLQSNPTWLSIVNPNMLFPGTTLFPEGSGNSVGINVGVGGTSPGFIFGGLSQSSASQNNTVTVETNSTVNSSIYGGYVESGVGGASGNTVTLQSGSTVVKGIYGGKTFAGEVADNHVIIKSGATTGQMIWGGASDIGNVTNNTVTVTDASVAYTIFGGLTYNAGTISGNKIIMVNSNITDGMLDLYGGLANKDGDVRQNSVTISGNSTINANGGGYRSVLGGQSTTGLVYGNEVLLSGQVTAKNIIGGSVSKEAGSPANLSGTAQKNRVTLKAENGYSPVVNTVIGGQVTAGVGDACENEVFVESGIISGNIIGGSVNGTGNSYKNQVSISGSATAASLYAGYSAASAGYVSQNLASLSGTASLTGSLYAGYSLNSYALANQALITGGTITGWVYGGRSETSYANENIVTVTGGKMAAVIGGYARNAMNGKADSNNVSFKDAETTGSLYGGFSTLAASNNTVTIDGTALIGSAASGGLIYGGYSTAGSANKNRVIIKNGTIKGNTSTSIYGGFGYGGEASENEVFIDGGTIDKTIYAGYGVDGANDNSITVTGGKMATLIGGLSANGDAKGNRISISGGEVTGNIFAGYTVAGNATGNTVTLSGNPNLTLATIVGGYKASGGGDIFTDNTLIINAPTVPLEVTGILNVQNYQFVLPAGVTHGRILVQSTDAVNMTGSTVQSLGIASGGFLLSEGHYVTLIHNVSTAPQNNGATLVANVGVMTYNFNLALHGNSLDVTLGSIIDSTPLPDPKSPISLNLKTKALTEAQVAGLSFLTQAGDLAAVAGINSLLESADDANNETTLAQQKHFGFGVLSGANIRSNTGSHVRVNGFSLIVGVGTQQDLNAGQLTFGGFFETGKGTVSTYNSFNALPDVKGNGDTRYTGVGALIHQSSPSGFYADSSVHIGRINTDFNSADFTDSLGQSAHYDMNATYMGLHVGIGKIMTLNSTNQLDMYSQYFWTHQSGKSVEVLGDKIEFEAMNSHRLRVGSRYNYLITEATTLYVGAALEREFEGKAKATVYGYAIDAPELKGNSGISELGVNFRPTKSLPLTLNLGIQGYVGQREGATGNVYLKYAF